MNRQDRFFQQSHVDSTSDYVYLCKNPNSENWDWIVLTAANSKQEEAYRLQIDIRRKEGRLPLKTRFEVVPDYHDQRIGSGGATLNVIKVIIEHIGYERMLQQKILVIHSGGDSKRIPQYSACGKLFAPLPALLPDGNISTIFDEMLIISSGIPGRINSGVMIFPSDTEMLFNPLQLDLKSCDAAGLSIKAPVIEGQEHGVFLAGDESYDGRNKNVSRFLHKQSESILRNAGAVDNADNVDIDTGAVWLGRKIVKALAETFIIDGKISEDHFNKFVNPDVCLNFYSDFVYPLADDGSIEEFQRELPENGFSDSLTECRNKLWESLHEFHLSLIRLTPGKYIHFGMTHEIYDTYVHHINDYEFLGWQKRIHTNANDGVVFNSLVNTDINVPTECFIEDSMIGDHTVIGQRTILSNVDTEKISVPDDVVLSGLQLKNGQYICRIYGREDNPKSSGNGAFLNGSIRKLMEATDSDSEAVWCNDPASIWNARVFIPSDTMAGAAENAMIVYRLINGYDDDNDIAVWKHSEKYSLRTSFEEADVPALLDRHKQIGKQYCLRSFYRNIYTGNDSIGEIHNLCDYHTSSEISWYLDEIIAYAEKCEFPANMRLYLAASDICRIYGHDVSSQNYTVYEDRAYGVIKDSITNAVRKEHSVQITDIGTCRDCIVELPVRVNFCGSPSDAAPYCLEHGGTMVDGTLLLNGKKPISVTVRKTNENGIRLTSRDLHSSELYADIEDIRDCENTSDTFSLHKSAIVATGILDKINSLDELLNKTGFEIETSVNIPKGSGLGTSSIIAAALIKAIHEFFDIEISEKAVYAEVFLTEQLMNTGGGWQDQVGGYTPGIKYFTSHPGLYQDIEVDNLKISDRTMAELNNRFALIFSGQRRLARNVLREEMNQTIRNDTSAISVIKTIQEYCAIMRYYLLKGDITEFARYISKQFELVKKLDKGASNTCIEYIFDVCDDLIDGKSICGAGGGGFLQVILKEGVTKAQLKERIQGEFGDCGVSVWDCELI